MLPVLKELKGFLKVQVYDCEHPDVQNRISRFEQDIVCDYYLNKERFPSFLLVSADPDGGKLKKESFPKGNITEFKFKKWIVDFIPDFSVRMNSLIDYSDSEFESDINKVILFSDKDRPTPVYKTLSTNFLHRLRFYYVQLPGPGEDMPTQISDILRKFGIDHQSPTLLVDQSFDPMLEDADYA